MNIALQYIRMNWNRLGLDRFGSTSNLSSFIATPRFRASRHIVFLIFMGGQSHPALIAKVPRLASDAGSLDREASNLKAVHLYQPDRFDSIPSLIAYEDFKNSKILLETALTGQVMTGSLVQRNPLEFVEAVMLWLIKFHQTTRQTGKSNRGWFHRLVEDPCTQFLESMSNSIQEYRLIKLTQKHIRNLQRTDLPVVFEHGDLGPPNILLCTDGTIGVVDWELAEPEGFPALDLFFLLALIGFARQRCRKKADYLAAFQSTFFGKNPWAKPYINTYGEKLNIAPEILQGLFLFCWSRCVMNIAQRLRAFDSSGGVFSDKAAFWLRSNRYYALWQYAVDHMVRLNLVD